MNSSETTPWSFDFEFRILQIIKKISTKKGGVHLKIEVYHYLSGTRNSRLGLLNNSKN